MQEKAGQFINPELLKKLENNKDSDVRELVAQVQKVLESPHYEHLVSLLVQRMSWNKQYTEKSMNLFNPEDKPVFEIAHKYFQELKPYIELEEYLRSKLTVQQQEKAKEAANAFERSLQRNGLMKDE